ncbi:DUF1850 domain-containing protein [uncultured Metabacillus sp.]|uniref:DUF1850 domain-containing protein n=1 Tax=uncultured Metabacillus sp. TaxID=2860135 RepID=UPI00262ABCB5|nr:DUF1850 domain-containing protein [uncultured Metabacillus sp.]
MRNKWMTGVLFLVPLLLFSAFLFFFPYKQVIAFTYEDKEQLLAYLSLKQDKSFQIQYTHSIHLSDVFESYRLSAKHIVQTELSYEDFAVGMPSNAEGDEVFEEVDGRYYIRNMNRSFPFIDLRIGQVRANHRLIYKDKTYTLSNYIKPGTWVRISVTKLSIWQQLKGVSING